MSQSQTKTLGYLPNICSPQALLRAVMAALILGSILAVSVASELTQLPWLLGSHTLFTAWVVLVGLFAICLISRLVENPNSKTTTLIVLGVSLTLTLIASFIGMAVIKVPGQEGFSFDGLFLFKNLLISTVITLALLRYFFIHKRWQETVEADTSAKYDALQSRMRPHFLFNSLNTVAHLVHKDPNRAEEAILDLADIMRTTLDKRTRITLQEEIDLTLRYLRMESLRLGKRRLTVIWDMDKNTLPFNMNILPLILQPVVENAIYHGIQPRKDGGTLGIGLYDAGDHLKVSVTNPLPPSDANLHQKGNHIAQENMKNRLKLAYGDRANLQILKTDQQYRVSFSIPKE
ncbi:MAG: hypothetical protein RLZZ422_657 [Pseudomonadota bacterium]|jgi:two-component system sensor histidine kinase AlgZ